MTTTQKIKLDFARHGITPRVYAVQGDSYTREVEISLYENDATWEVPDGASVMVRYRKPNGTGNVYDTLPDGTPACSVNGNVLTIMLAPEVLTYPGVALVQPQITSGDAVIATIAFEVSVASDPSALAPGSAASVSWQQWTEAELARMLEEAKASGDFDGPTPRLSIGTVVTVDYDADAYAKLTGTTDAPVLNLGIPRGKPGSAVIETIGTGYVFGIEDGLVYIEEVTT